MRPGVMTAIFLVNRTWPIQQLRDGTAQRLVQAALAPLSMMEVGKVLEAQRPGARWN